MSSENQNLVNIPVDGIKPEGEVRFPDGVTGLVVFAHGSGSTRHSPRNDYVAEVLRDHGLGTLLFDLLIEEEDRSRENRFDIPRLTDRLIAVTEWLDDRTETSTVSIGYFGSSTGTAAQLGTDTSL